MECTVEKFCLCPFYNCFDVTFGNSILMVGSNTTENILFIWLITVRLEISGGKDYITRMVLLDMESFISCQGLKLVFACDSFRSSSRYLGVIEELSTCIINKKSTTCICDCHYHGSLVSNQEQQRYSGQQKYNPLVWCGQLLEFFLDSLPTI